MPRDPIREDYDIEGKGRQEHRDRAADRGSVSDRILNLWTPPRPWKCSFSVLAPPNAQILPEVPPRSCPQPYSPPSPQPSRRDIELFAPQTSLGGLNPCRTHR